MGKLEELLKIERIDSEPSEVATLFDEETKAEAKRFIVETLRRKYSVSMAEVGEHVSARSVHYATFRLGAGFDIFLPCDVDTGKIGFVGEELAMSGLDHKTSFLGLEVDPRITPLVECREEGRKLVVVRDDWEQHINNWYPLSVVIPPSGIERSLEGRKVNGGFTIYGIYNEWDICCKAGRTLHLDDRRDYGVDINYGVKIEDDTPDGKFDQFTLNIQNQLSHNLAIIYSIDVCWDSKSERYIPKGSIDIRRVGKNIEIDIGSDGRYSSEFDLGDYEYPLDVLRILYTHLGNPDTDFDFAASIQNAFDAADQNKMSMLVSNRFLIRRDRFWLPPM